MIKTFFFHLKKIDWILNFSVFFIILISLFSIFSSCIGRNDFLNFEKQIIFFVTGFLLMLIISFVDWRTIKETRFFWIIYLLVTLSLIGLFFFSPEIRGTKSWYKIGDFSVNPIELMKIILLILLSQYFSKMHIEMYKIKHILISGLIIALPAILIFFQPNFGGALTLIALWIIILLISGIRIRHFFILAVLGALIFVLLWSFFLRDYQKERLVSFLQPQFTNELTTGWNQNQAKIAIGSGGFLGKGLGKGSQVQLGFLPEAQTDFIFSAIAEEFGLVTISALSLLFFIFIWRIAKIALKNNSGFVRIFALGFAGIILFESLVNIGMNLGFFPIIGWPLPFVSYGGSELIINFIALGILQNMKANSRTY